MSVRAVSATQKRRAAFDFVLHWITCDGSLTLHLALGTVSRVRRIESLLSRTKHTLSDCWYLSKRLMSALRRRNYVPRVRFRKGYHSLAGSPGIRNGFPFARGVTAHIGHDHPSLLRIGPLHDKANPGSYNAFASVDGAVLIVKTRCCIRNKRDLPRRLNFFLRAGPSWVVPLG